MGEKTCPKCGAKVQPSDLVCLECGADLIALKNESSEPKFKIEAPSGTREADKDVTPVSAAHGVAAPDEKSEKTRIRVYDHHYADQLRSERITAAVTSVIALAATVGIAYYALEHMKQSGGLAALKQSTPAEILRLAYSAFTGQSLMSLWLVVLALAAALFLIGQTMRTIITHQSIAAVAMGQKPLPVGIHPATQLGLILLAFLVPVLGLIIGILMKLSSDDDTRAIGGTVILVSFISLAAVGVSFLWDMAGSALQNVKPEAIKPSG